MWTNQNLKKTKLVSSRSQIKPDDVYVKSQNCRLSSGKHNEESKMDTEETLYNTNNNTVIEGVSFNCLFKKFYKRLQYIYRETRTATKNRRCRKSETTFTFDYRFDMAETSGYQDMNAGISNQISGFLANISRCVGVYKQ